MFTGLIEAIGKVSRIKHIAGGKKINISFSRIGDDIEINDSLAVNGVCLTVTEKNENSVWVDAVGVTLSKTTLRDIREGGVVNLERALLLSDRLGGHFVQGHVNGIGEIADIQKLGENYALKILIPSNIKRYVISEGSIAIDGISLTIADIIDLKIEISVIPHTWNNTTLKNAKIGQKVNIETDMLAKYVENFINSTQKTGETYTDNWFEKLGY